MRQAMAGALLLTIAASSPVSAQPAAAPPPSGEGVTAVPATIAPTSPTTPVPDLDPRSLANRAITRELSGDRPGAIADLSAAIAKESDPARRASMENLLQLLQSPR